ncbi:PilC/PilY family type IV pilus protein [Pseudomonas sp. PS01301]|uniref:pilus assembly protein n=1 Tax=Pseudomonas sp. PS01301 TaxID=2991437 RepID=UPI00249C93FD|nr:PilC/PilY family type IV pilus protein [Pseudomonas sp. PS01301]
MFKLVLGLLAGLYVSAPLYAFTPSDSPLLSSGSVAPNVMLLVDDSGSMDNLIRATGFDQSVTRTQIYICGYSNSCNQYYNVDMDNENLFYSSFRQGACSLNYSGFLRPNGVKYCLRLPDPVGNGNTRYSARYISYLIDQLPSGTTTKNYTDNSIPQDYRINVARAAASAIVDANRTLRIGLATFNPPRSGDSGPGGFISRNVADISTTTSAGPANYRALQSAIDDLGSIANTPLAETYYEITRYFRGLTPYYNSTPSTYTSPIQYRCQKNYGVVITDGLPTYDRTFPTNDPLGGSRLPNWDGNSANDGDNLNGDGEGDTLYLDDIAKFAYDIDMRTGGTDAAGKSWDAADFPKQNMSTYTVGFAANNQMLRDAAELYGQGKYYQATDAAGLSAALTAALNDIASKAGSGGGATVNSVNLTASSQYYQTFYDPTDWRGSVRAYGLDAKGSPTSTLLWSTDSKVTSAGSTTFQSFNTTTAQPITLALGNFSPAQQATLATGLPSGVSNNDLVEWTKGTNKTGLKVRSVLLGDIINSPLVYASPTAISATDTTGDFSYTNYLDTKATAMTPSLVVGSNDGMTSVLNTDGTRRYAYLPSSTLSNLRYVADPTYINGTGHKFLNDGQMTVADAKIGSSWRTLALGGVGAGGRTYYALQLFQASSNTVRALWEISNTTAGYGNIGYAYGKPEVARLSNGTWAAFISNGYGSTSGRASLFVVDVSNGKLINEIQTPVVVSGETDNGLSSVALEVNSQGVVQYAYGGDLKGRMWKFDFTSTTNGAVGFSGSPLFTASGGASQPITAQPTIGSYTQGRQIIFFGTGKLNEVADKTTTATQAFYAIVDANGSTANYTESSLQRQTITNITGNKVYTSQNTVDYNTRKGWYMPLTYGTTATGERVLYPALLFDGRVYFTTAILDTTDPCSSAGSSKLMEVDAESGQRITNFNIFGGLESTSGLVIGGGLVNVASFVSYQDAAGNDMVALQLPNTGNGGTSGGSISGGDDDPKNSVTDPGSNINRRIMWQQRQ